MPATSSGIVASAVDVGRRRRPTADTVRGAAALQGDGTSLRGPDDDVPATRPDRRVLRAGRRPRPPGPACRSDAEPSSSSPAAASTACRLRCALGVGAVATIVGGVGRLAGTARVAAAARPRTRCRSPASTSAWCARWPTPTSGRRGPTRRPPARPLDAARDRRRTCEAEVVVVGSGAGGATTAALLAEAGFDVLVVEEGRESSQGEVVPFSLEPDGPPVPRRRGHRRARPPVDRLHRGLLRRRRHRGQQRPVPPAAGGGPRPLARRARHRRLRPTSSTRISDEVERDSRVQPVPGAQIGGQRGAAPRRRRARLAPRGDPPLDDLPGRRRRPPRAAAAA